jgi:hypothetical protein
LALVSCAAVEESWLFSEVTCPCAALSCAAVEESCSWVEESWLCRDDTLDEELLLFPPMTLL